MTTGSMHLQEALRNTNLEHILCKYPSTHGKSYLTKVFLCLSLFVANNSELCKLNNALEEQLKEASCDNKKMKDELESSKGTLYQMM